MTQTEIVKNALIEEKKELTIKEISVITGILEPNVRRILGQGYKKGIFQKLGKGIYTVETKDGVKGIFKMGDSLKEVKKLKDSGIKFDMVFLDIPYKTKAVTGGNRGVRYPLISVKQFDEFIGDLKPLLKDENTPIIHMFSNAKSGFAEMEKYNNCFIKYGFLKVDEGSWTKIDKKGNIRTNMRGDKMIPEGISIFKLNNIKENLDINVRLPRTKTASEKPKELIDLIIEKTTKIGTLLLDPFAGTGIFAKRALKLKRNVMTIELSGKRFYKEILGI